MFFCFDLLVVECVRQLAMLAVIAISFISHDNRELWFTRPQKLPVAGKKRFKVAVKLKVQNNKQ